MVLASCFLNLKGKYILVCNLSDALIMHDQQGNQWRKRIFNRPGVAGAVLQSPPSLMRHWLSDPLVQIYSKQCQSQTGRARELKC